MTTSQKTQQPEASASAPQLPAAIKQRLKAESARAQPVEDAPAASSVPQKFKNRFRPLLKHFARTGFPANPASAVANRVGKFAAATRAAAARFTPQRTDGQPRQNNDTPKLLNGLRATGFRIGTALDAIAHRHHRRSAPSTTTHRPVPTFDATPPAAVGQRPSVFALGALATAFVTAGLIHLVTTFVMPLIGTGSAYSKLKPALPVNRMIILPQQGPGQQVLPFISPDTLYAICRFDISANPVVVKAQLPAIGWTLTLYTPAGDNFYAMPGTAQGATDVSLMMVPPTDRLLAMMPGARREDMKMNQIVAPSREGLIVVRAPIKATALVEETSRELAKSSCAPSELAAPLR